MTKGEVSQEKISEAAFGLFVSQGYHGTSMRQIAQAAGLTPASLYNHFDNKEGIFQQVLLQHHPYHQLLPILESAKGDDAESLIRDVAQRAYDVVRTRRELLHLMFIEIVEFDGRHIGEIFSKVSPQIFAFLNKLEKTDGQLRPVSKPNLLLAMIGMVMSQWLLEAAFLKNIELPASKHFETALDIYLHGILASTHQENA